MLIQQNCIQPYVLEQDEGSKAAPQTVFQPDLSSILHRLRYQLDSAAIFGGCHAHLLCHALPAAALVGCQWYHHCWETLPAVFALASLILMSHTSCAVIMPCNASTGAQSAQRLQIMLQLCWRICRSARCLLHIADSWISCDGQDDTKIAEATIEGLLENGRLTAEQVCNPLCNAPTSMSSLQLSWIF